LNSSNLPSGSFDDILIRCKKSEEKSEFTVNACDENFTLCTCSNLDGGTEYKIEIITRKKNLNDAIFENIAHQYTSNN
jgi:hypothetical protein